MLRHRVNIDSRTLLVVVAVLSLTGCVTPRGIESVPAGKVLVPQFDDREWVVKTHHSDRYKSMIEYLPKGDSPAAWTESLGGTYRGYELTNTTPQLDYQAFQSDVLQVCPSARFDVLQSPPGEL